MTTSARAREARPYDEADLSTMSFWSSTAAGHEKTLAAVADLAAALSALEEAAASTIVAASALELQGNE